MSVELLLILILIPTENPIAKCSVIIPTDH